MQRVTSRHNERINEARRLAQSSRDRRKLGRCILEGKHLTRVYVDRVGPPATLIVVDWALDDPAIAGIVRDVPSTRVLQVPPTVFAEIAVLPIDVGVLAVIETPRHDVTQQPQFALLLEDLQDPGNVGTILRTAAAAGADQVLLSKQCAFAWSPKVLRAAQGAHFLTLIAEDVDLPSWSARFRTAGGRVLALDAHADQRLFDAAVSFPLAIAVGNEGAGLSDALRSVADARITIPMPGGTESLNAAAAAAVALFECVRRRLQQDR
ncbi:MAG TPA: RNA methyltransferase [Casimicrobiaceae bacterium]|nr:RNA methyltransferase [Casimicrobiaceae bacterium]